MMGFQSDQPPKLFHPSINLQQRVPGQHLLRKIQSRIDSDFIYEEVRDCCGANGNVPVPPPAILKMMLIPVFYSARSERELMNTIPLRLDWPWFSGYDLDSEVPNHSVLSKARMRWGVEAFRRFFERIVWQCVQAGLADGTKPFMDSSLIEADAPNNSVVRRGKGGAGLEYKIHRAVDGSQGVITAAEAAPGEVDEAHRMLPLIDQRRCNTKRSAESIVADTKYGTVENYLACGDRGLKARFPDIKQSQANTGRRKGIFPEEAFRQEPETDLYVCPAGRVLRPRRHHRKQPAIDYLCDRGVCDACALRSQCTTAKTGRRVKRRARPFDLERMREPARSEAARRGIRIRQHLMEGSFADAVRCGFKQARWRRLRREQIQEYLTAAIQNMMKLLQHEKERGIPYAFRLGGAAPGAAAGPLVCRVVRLESLVSRAWLFLSIPAHRVGLHPCWPH